MSGSHVYIIAESKISPVKIGVAGSLNGRLRELQIGNPRRLRLLYSIEVGGHRRARRVESMVHALCAEHRIRGEWFKREAVKIAIHYLDRPASWSKEPKGKDKTPGPLPYTEADDRNRVAIFLTIPGMSEDFPTDELAAAKIGIFVGLYCLYKDQWARAGRPLPQGWTKDTVESLAA